MCSKPATKSKWCNNIKLVAILLVCIYANFVESCFVTVYMYVDLWCAKWYDSFCYYIYTLTCGGKKSHYNPIHLCNCPILLLDLQPLNLQWFQ